MRFRCLLKHRVLHYSPPATGTIVNACTVLHNMCVQSNFPKPEIEEHIDDFGVYELQLVKAGLLVEPAHADPDLVIARRMREQIIRNYF